MKHYDTLDLLGNAINNLATPAVGTDAATKAYVDTAAGGGMSPSLYDANTVLKADTDNTPVALPVPASSFVGRGAAGSIAALTGAQAKAILAIVVGDVSGLGALASKSTIVDADVAAGAAIALSKLATDPLARANHTGTQLAATISNLAASVVPFTPTGTIAASNVQAAIAEVAAEAGSGITPNTGWSVTAGYTADKAFNPESTTVTEVARALGTLIDALKAQNILGA